MLHNGMQFKCDMCGECCRHIDRIHQLKLFDTGNGTCKYLKDSLCSIYENRPDICRVDYMYEKFFLLKMSLDEYYHLNAIGCVELKSLQK